MTITIAARFRGPDASANGGYSAGLLAAAVDGDAEVTLRRPPPLDTRMVTEMGDGGVKLLDGDELVALATPATVELDLPESPGVEAARRASAGYAGFESHAFPRCFSCGPERTDGLGIFPGPIGESMVAAVFEPDPTLPTDDRSLAEPVVWAALDCAGAWTEHRKLAEAPVVLGRMAAHIAEPVPRHGEFVVVGWPLGRDGRKLFAATVLFDAAGKALAWSRQTWILLSR